MASTSFNWDYIRTITLEYKDKIISAHIVAIFATLANVPVPLLMPLLVDEVLLKEPGKAVNAIKGGFPESWHSPALYILVILLFSLMLRLIAIIFNIIQAKQFSFLSKTIIYRIRENLTRHLQSISMTEYESLGSGTIVTYMTTDLNTLDNFIGSTISRLLVATLTIFGTAIILLWMHWQLGLFILLLNPVVIYFTTLVGKHVKELKSKENSAYEVFQLSLSETLEAIHQIRASNREQHYFSQLIDTAKSVKEHAINFSWKSDAANRFSFVIFLFGFDVFRATAMFMVVYSNLTIGEMLAVFGYLWFMMSPVQEVLGIQYAYYSAKAALDRINRLLHLQKEPSYPHLVNPFINTHTVSVRIENLHFSYDEESKILNGISLNIKKGEKVALVGASGGGKSTLVQVLIGLYPANSGMIYFDDIPLDQIGLNIVRENVVTVLQHPTLFNDTIRSNLALGREATDLQLWQALKIAQLDQAISHLDNGLDTIIGRQGMRLSGGQRQRIAIARMIIANPRVVILDESTSALDSQTERKLHLAMTDFLSQRTTIIVAHRLSAVKLADKVYVFEEGQICEQGSHHDLIKQQGLYSKLYGEHQT